MKEIEKMFYSLRLLIKLNTSSCSSTFDSTCILARDERDDGVIPNCDDI